ncbi:MAG: hypothetical protein A2W80_13690 [Candidatus Riflebacteria bacterium GWC2_50_8]|nr:MAG: hypothetical protein A2W80_13690 [Candidatus Riflebacteria bacterium GWC2_50_8]
MLNYKLHLLLLFMLVAGQVYCSDTANLQLQPDYIKVWHDDAGMPHVVASTTYGAFWGYGYCLARDRMFQLEILRRSTEGTLAEIFGPDYIEADFLARRDRVSPNELSEGLKNCPEDFAIALIAFTNGINRAITDACAGKFTIDPAFEKADTRPTPFSQLQILDIFAGTMAARYNDFAMELDNQHLLNSLVRKYGARAASEIFEDVVFYEDPEIYTTLGNMPFFKPGFRFIPRTDPAGSFTAPTNSPTLQNQKRNRLLKSLGVPDKSGSYGAALSLQRGDEKRALLFGGPQMGYFKPSAVYGIGLHTPEFDIVGTTPVGYVFIMFAANRHIAFTSTAGVGNLVDLLSLKRSEDFPDQLSGTNCTVKLVSRTEKIAVKGLPQPIEREITETDLGPVVAVEGNTYYVKHRAWSGKVVESYAGWFASTFADSLQSWLAASDRNALSINWLGADCAGNIAFVHCGLGKSRRSFGDDRLPVSRPTDFIAPDKRLAGNNPTTGFYANWNCPPVKGYRNGDLQTNWAADQRSRFLADHLAANRDNWSLDYLVQLDKDIAFTDQRAYFFKDFLVSFISENKLSASAKEALDLLRGWDNLRTDRDENGFYDNKGAGLFNAFFNALYNDLLAAKLDRFAWMSASDATWTQSALLAKALLRQSRHDYLGTRDARDYVTEIFAKVFAENAADGRNLPEFAAQPMEFAAVNHAGAPTMTSVASCTPFMNRGSDIQMVELSPSGVKIFGCMPPGNAASGKSSADQMRAFKEFRYSARPLLLKDVRGLRGRFMVIAP